MKNLYIPKIGDIITLAEPWTFKLYEEYRNLTLIKNIDPSYTRNGYSSKQTWDVTFPAGFELQVDRIYIRNGRQNFDSITFRCPYNGKKVRFWVKLKDANKILMLEGT